MKKGNANMWWIIIGAVIALVVMIVLMVMFTSKTSDVEQGLSECSGKGGNCTPEGECEGIVSTTFECSEGVCCFERSAILGKDGE